MPDLRRLSRETVLPLANLAVREDQSGLVAPNALTMAQSMFEPGAEIHGIWQGDTPVGMIAVVDLSAPQQELEEGDERDGLAIWRLMIAADHQRRGYGVAALRFAIDLARDRDLAHVSVSSVDAVGCAIPFYEQQGFHRTGKIIGGEVQLIFPLR